MKPAKSETSKLEHLSGRKKTQTWVFFPCSSALATSCIKSLTLLTPPHAKGFDFATVITDRNPFDPRRLVEARPRLDIWRLQREGALTRGATITLDEKHGGYLRPLHGSRIQVELEASTVEIQLVGDEPMPGVTRRWWSCPACRRRARHLYWPELACRRCLRLTYAINNCSRWGNLYTVIALRRALGVDERPFSEILSPQRRRARFWRLSREIAR